ncbi:hypothetical protein C4587_02215 [Candidatus Parcubacteria bacterium]|nr:MAG: hypothetical protein C4587_02215 [Candidatus Parcubacteria bacterium]
MVSASLFWESEIFVSLRRLNPNDTTPTLPFSSLIFLTDDAEGRRKRAWDQKKILKRSTTTNNQVDNIK